MFLPAEFADGTVTPSWVAHRTFICGSIRVAAVVSIYKTNSNSKFIIPYFEDRNDDKLFFRDN